VIIDDGATFKPRINKKSEKLIREKELGNNMIEFPMSNNAVRPDLRNLRR